MGASRPGRSDRGLYGGSKKLSGSRASDDKKSPIRCGGRQRATWCTYGMDIATFLLRRWT
jgi:hypothetical protein